MLRFLVLSLLLILAGCAKMPDRPVDRKYQLHGVIKRLDPQQQTATIKHEKIEGWMEPMTMEFPVISREEFTKLKVGQTIRATVFVRADLDYRIGEIRWEDAPPR
jgi:Cu/Ag efflux protein CusF